MVTSTGAHGLRGVFEGERQMRRLAIAMFGAVVVVGILAVPSSDGGGGLSGGLVLAASTQDGPRRGGDFAGPRSRPVPDPPPSQPAGRRDAGGGLFEIVLATPVAWGDLTGAQFCPEGMYVSGIEQRVEPFQGSDRDDAGMTGLRFGCSGTGSAMLELPSPPGVDWGNWTGAQFCPEGMHVSGIEQRIEPYQGPDRDDAGMTGLRFFCRAS